MARKVQVVLLDDIDGGEAERTVSFSLDGTHYQIDLNPDNIDKLNKSLTPFIENARRAPARATGRRRPAAGGNAAEIRTWARDQGMQVPDRGRIPNEIREAYEAAH